MNKKIFDNSLKHKKLTELLKKEILEGFYKTGDKLPSQNEMAKKYSISPSTVREAVTSLVHEKILTRIQGKGTFVADFTPRPLIIAAVMPHLYLRAESEYGIGFNIIPPIVQSIEMAMKKYNANLMLYLADDDPEYERLNLLNLMQNKIDGAIIFCIGCGINIDIIKKMQKEKFPFILLDRYMPEIETSYIISDNEFAAYDVTNKLIKMEMRNIICIVPNIPETTVKDRISGYSRAIKDAGLDEYIYELNNTGTGFDELTGIPEVILGTKNFIKQVYAELPKPFAIFAINAHVLTGAWMAIQELEIPHSDVALATFDESMIKIPDDVSLIQVVQRLEEMGKQSVDAVMDQLNGNADIKKIVIPSEILVSAKVNSDILPVSENWR